MSGRPGSTVSTRPLFPRDLQTQKAKKAPLWHRCRYTACCPSILLLQDRSANPCQIFWLHIVRRSHMHSLWTLVYEFRSCDEWRSGRVFFDCRLSASRTFLKLTSSHSSRNLACCLPGPFYQFSQSTYPTYQGLSQCYKAVREDSMWHFSSPMIAYKPWYST